MRPWTLLDDDIILPERVEKIGELVLDAAYAVHSAFGRGALESVYARAMARALERRGLRVEREVWIPVVFEGEVLERALRADMVVEGSVLVEIKAVEAVHPVHFRQVVSYLRLGRMPLGYLLNFQTERMKFGIRRFINNRVPDGVAPVAGAVPPSRELPPRDPP